MKSFKTHEWLRAEECPLLRPGKGVFAHAAKVRNPPVVSKASGMLSLARLSAKGCMTDTPESKGLVRGRLPFFISAATHSLA